MSIAARSVTATKTGAYTAAPNEVVPVDASGGAFSVALPRPINGVGKAPITIGPKIDGSANVVTVTTPVGAIVGMAALTTTGDVCTYVTNGTNWFALDTPATAAAPAPPSAPTAVVGTRGNAQVSVAFTPGATNGATVTGYTVTASPGGATATGSTSPIVVTGLTNGTAYTFTVHTNATPGNSPESSPSAAVTPATVPGAPTIGTATAGDTTASFPFTPPASTGGATVTSYTATLSPGGATFSGSSSPIAATGLTNGTAYTATIHATNAVGNSSESSASNAVTPAGFSPLLLANLVRWGDPQTLTAGTLTTYADSGPAGTTVAQSSAGSKPTVVAAVLSGKNVVRFDGTNDFLVSANFGTAETQPNTAVLVVKLAGAPASAVKFIDGGGAGRNALYVSSSDGTSESLVTFMGSGGGTPAAAAYTHGNWAILLVEFNAASSKLYVNGGAAFTGVASSGDTNAMGRITLACDDAQSGGFVNGDYADDLFIGGLLTVSEKNQLGAWLVAKYPALTWNTVTA